MLILSLTSILAVLTMVTGLFVQERKINKGQAQSQLDKYIRETAPWLRK